MSPTHFGLPSPSDDPTLPTSPCLPLTEPIRLDDVLDTSILDSDPVDAPATLSKPYSIISDPETNATDDDERHLQNVSRWDRIPMGTLRYTRDGPSNLAYDDIIRGSPFDGVWPSDKGRNKPSGTPSKKGNGKREGLVPPTQVVFLNEVCRSGDAHPDISPRHYACSRHFRDVTVTTRRTDPRLAKTITILCTPSHAKTRHHAEIK